MSKANIISFVPFMSLYAEKLEGKQLASVDLVPMHEVTGENGETEIFTAELFAAREAKENETVVNFQRMQVTLAAAEGEDAEIIEVADVPMTYAYEEINQSLSIAHHKALGNEFKAIYNVETGALYPLAAEAIAMMVERKGKEATLDIEGDAICIVGTEDVDRFRVADATDQELMFDEFIRANAMIDAKERFGKRMRAGVSEVLFDGYNLEEIAEAFKAIAGDLVHIGHDTFVGDDFDVRAIREQPDQMAMMQGNTQGGKVIAFRVSTSYGNMHNIDAFFNTYLAKFN